MKPNAIRNLAMVRGTDGLLRLETVDGRRQVVLDPLAELVWELSDASRSIEDLTQDAGRALDRVVEKEEIFSALDFLADAGLLEERVAPPVAEAKVSRRSLLVQMAPVVGAGAYMMLGTSAIAGAGLFQESITKANNNEANSKEANSKENNTKENNRKANDREANGKADNNEANGKEDYNKRQQRIKELTRDSNEAENVESRSKVDRTGIYKVAPNHPLVGKWITFIYGATRILTISSSGILEDHTPKNNFDQLRNWKYTRTGTDTGVVETFLGGVSGWRGNVRWISRDEFEYTPTFPPGSVVGTHERYVRDNSWREVMGPGR